MTSAPSTAAETATTPLFRSTLSQRVDAQTALDEALAELDASGAPTPDLVTLFITPHHVHAAGQLSAMVRARFPGALLIGCSAEGVIGGGHEADRREALSLTVGWLPGTRVHPVRLEGRVDPTADWVAGLGTFATPPHFVLMPDPYSCDMDRILPLLDAAFPTSSKTGGLISGGDGPGDSVLFLGDEVHYDGLVGIAIEGDAGVQPLVAQGCRPIGDAMIITRLRDNVVYELNVGKPVKALQDVYRHLDPRDQERCHDSLFLGIEMDSKPDGYQQGDFLLGDVLGMDPRTGAMAVGRPVHDYQVVQFHLRDAATSARDLSNKLAQLDASVQSRTRAAMLFSCVGRGEALYGVQDHDAELLKRHLGEMPVFGYFSNGEIGRAAGRTFVHGFTTTAALLG